MCSASEKFGTFKLNTASSKSIVTLYKDSTFVERSTSNAENKKCKGRWWPVNERDSIVEMMTHSCGNDIYTLTPTRKLKIKEGELIETR
jgi:hypothetical protein